MGKVFGNDLVKIYHQAHILVLPSYFEPWGLVINEALAAGMAVICSTAVGAASDLVLHPDSGWVFENKNGRHLEEILLYCIQNRIECKTKALNGQQFLMNYWNYDRYKSSLYNILEYVESY